MLNKGFFLAIISTGLLLINSCQSIKTNNINNKVLIDNNSKTVISKYNNKKGYFFSGSDHCNYNNILYETYITDLQTKSFKKIKSKDDNLSLFKMSTNEKEIIVETKNRIKKLNIESNSETEILSNLSNKDISLDKQNIVYTKINENNEMLIYTCDIDGNNQKKIYSLKEDKVNNIIWSNNKEYIGIDIKNKIMVIDINGKLIKEFELINKKSSDRLSWSPDSKKLCYHEYDNHKLTIIDIENKKEIILNSEYGFLWSPNGKKIVYSSIEARDKKLYYFDIETNNQKLISERSSYFDIMNWSSDSNNIYFYSLENRDKIIKRNIYKFNLSSNKKSLIDENISTINKFTVDENISIYEKEEDSKSNLYLFNVKNMNLQKILNLNGERIKNIILSKNKKFLLLSMSSLTELSETLIDTNSDIYSLDLDTPNKLTRITKSPTDENAYEFISDNKILFSSQISRFVSCKQEDIENWDYTKSF